MEEPRTGDMLYNSSDDLELKGLVDQLIKADRITQEQLERIKHYVTGEPGCSESVIRTKDSPENLFQHLMDVNLVTRCNVAFLQSLFWRAGLKDLCQDVALYARKYDRQSVRFFSIAQEIDNGCGSLELHVQSNLEKISNHTVDELCYRISRYTGVPRSSVIPAGIKRGDSIIITVWIPVIALKFLENMADLSWLLDLSVDRIMINRVIILKEGPDTIPVEENNEKLFLEPELQKKTENERRLKQYQNNGHIPNKTRRAKRDQNEEEKPREKRDQNEEEKPREKEQLLQQMRLNVRLFAAFVSMLHLISQLLRYNISKAAAEPLDLKERSVRAHYNDVLRRARRVCYPSVLQEVIDAHSLVKDVMYSRQISYVMQSFRTTVDWLQANCRDALTHSNAGRMTGAQSKRLLKTPQSQTILGVTEQTEEKQTWMLPTELDQIVVDLAKKLTLKEVRKIVSHYGMLEELLTDSRKHEVFRQLFIREITRTDTLSEDAVGRIMEEATTKVSERRDLWEEFKIRNKKRRQSHVQHQSNVPDRLGNIEKLLHHLVSQNLASPFGAGNPFQSGGFGMPTCTKENKYFKLPL